MLEIQVVVRDKPVTLNSVLVEMHTQREWMLLKRIPMDSITLYAGPPNKAREVRLEHPEIFSILNSSLKPSKTVTGFGLFGFSDPRPSLEGQPAFRLTLRNAIGQVVKIESSAPGSLIHSRRGAGKWFW